MQKSESIGKLADALAKAQGQMHNASKDAANPFFKSSYADLASIVAAIKGPLSANGLSYVQTTDTEDGAVIVETTLMHASGEWIAGLLRMRPVKDDPQGIGSCLTYARRYALQAIVGLAADEDDDSNAASGKTVPVKAQTARSQTPKETPKETAPQAPAAPAPASESPIICDDCTLPVEAHGDQWQPARIAGETKRVHGRVLCWGCGQKAKAAARG